MDLTERHRNSAIERPAFRAPGRLAGTTILAVALLAPQPARAGVSDLLEQAHWGESFDTLAREFGDWAAVLDAPIRFGDSYVNLVHRNEQVGGYPFNVYLQMDREDDGAILRATFRDTTLGALESCLGRSVPCRVTARLFLQLGPPAAIPEPCG